MAIAQRRHRQARNAFRPPARAPLRCRRSTASPFEHFDIRALASAQGVFTSWIALATTSGVCQLMHWLHTEALPTLSQFQSASHVEVVERQTQLTLILINKFLMAMVQCKECGGEISENANTCPHCGDVIKEPKPKFSLLDLVQKISVPVVLSVGGHVDHYSDLF